MCFFTSVVCNLFWLVKITDLLTNQLEVAEVREVRPFFSELMKAFSIICVTCVISHRNNNIYPKHKRFSKQNQPDIIQPSWHQVPSIHLSFLSNILQKQLHSSGLFGSISLLFIWFEITVKVRNHASCKILSVNCSCR